MEHLVQTVTNEVLSYKYLRKCWTLEQFLDEAKAFESTNLQVSEIRRKRKQSVAEVVCKKNGEWRYWTQEAADGQDVSTVGCLEYIPKAEIVLHITRDALCSKMGHFAVVYWTRQHRFSKAKFRKSENSCPWTKRRNDRYIQVGPKCVSVRHVRVKTANVVQEDNRKLETTDIC